MSFEYGPSLGIQNPFKIEGKIFILSGIFISAIGFYLMMLAQADLKQSTAIGWKDIIVGVSILLWGIGSIAFGILKVARFFIGRNAPSSLAANIAFNDNTSQEPCPYSSMEIESMLVGRKNLTFMEPKNLTQHTLYTMMPSLLFTPPPITNLISAITNALGLFMAGGFVYGISYFVASIGLLGDKGTKMLSIISFTLLVYLTYKLYSILDLNRKTRLHLINTLQKYIGFAAVSIVALTMFNNLGEINSLNEAVSFNAWPAIGIFILSTTIVFLSFWMLLKQRNYTPTRTDVSEHRENMQENLHPSEIIIHLENIILANRRYMEVPNRVYQMLKTGLYGENSDKGSFEGKILIETQPEFVPAQEVKTYTTSKIFITILAQVMIIGSAILAAWFGHAMVTQSALESLTTMLTLFFSTIILYTNGKLLERIAHTFWSELQFESLLVWLKMEGTFTESKISTGMAIHESTRSENTIARSSITNWMICSRITSSTFAESGVNNIENPRYIYEMKKDDLTIDVINQELHEFLSSRESIAGIKHRDIASSAAINNVNKISAPSLAGFLKIDGNDNHTDVLTQ